MTTHYNYGFALCPMLGFAVLAVGFVTLVILMIKPRLRRRWLLGLGIVVIAVSTLALLPSLVAIKARHTAIRARHAAIQQDRVAQAFVSAQHQAARLSSEFPADVYPSLRSAVLALGAHTEDLIAAIADGNVDTVPVVKIGGEVDREVLYALGKRIHDSYPKCNWFVEPGLLAHPGQPKANEIWVLVDVHGVQKHPSTKPARVEKEGVVRITLRHAKGSDSIEARFIDKPWVEHPAEFAQSYPKHKWIVTHSNQPGISPDEAIQAAIRNAAVRLEPPIREELMKRSSRSLHAVEATNAHWLRDHIEAELRAQTDLIADRFVQRFQRPYGTIWNAEVLADASPDKIAVIAREMDRSLAGRRVSFLRTALSIGGLVILICVVYLFLNAATSGYYTWSLRIAGAVFVVAGIAFVLTLV